MKDDDRIYTVIPLLFYCKGNTYSRLIKYDSKPCQSRCGLAVSPNGLCIALLHTPSIHRLQDRVKFKQIEVQCMSWIKTDLIHSLKIERFFIVAILLVKAIELFGSSRNVNTVEPPVSDHPKCQAFWLLTWRWSLTRGSKYSDLTWNWTFGILENWSLRGVVATGGSTVTTLVHTGFLSEPIKKRADASHPIKLFLSEPIKKRAAASHPIKLFQYEIITSTKVSYKSSNNNKNIFFTEMRLSLAVDVRLLFLKSAHWQ